MIRAGCSLALVSLIALANCSSDDDERAKKQKECDDIAADIRDKAVNVYGQPAQGACTNPALKPAFDTACARHDQCEKELSEL